MILAGLLAFGGVVLYQLVLYKLSWRHLYAGSMLLNGVFSAAQILLIQGKTFGIDPFWFALGATCLATASTFVYGDLLLLNELVAIWGIVGLSQIIGFKVGILSIDTIGHNNTMVFNSMPRIREIYKAILTARNLSHQSANFAISGEQTECN